MKRLHDVFGSRRERALTSRRRRGTAVAKGNTLRSELLEPRVLLAVTVPPDLTSDIVELDDNVLVAADVGGKAATIEATAGYVQIFGNSRGRIDAVNRADTSSLTLKATSAITVTGAIGSVAPFDSLTLTASATHAVNLQQAVTLDDDLVVTQAGSLTFGSTLVVGDDLTITQATNVLFQGNVTVVGDLTISSAAAVTFSGTLTVGGALRIVDATGAVRFLGDVSVAGADVTSRDRVIAQAGFGSTGAGGTTGDVSFTTDQIGFNAAIISTSAAASGVPTATLTVKPRTTSLPILVASPPGVPSGLLITDAAISAIQAGWKRVVFGDEAAGTGAVTVGSIGSQYGFSQLLNTTTIVGGSIAVVQPVDVTTQAAYLDLVARSGTITVKKPINQTADERNDWVRLTAAGAITLEAPVWAAKTVSLTSTASSVMQSDGFAAAITAPSLAVTSGGAVYLADSGNAFDTVAIKTSGGDVVLREDSGYGIGEIQTTDASRPSTTKSTVTGIDAGSGTVRLVTVDAVPTPVAVTQTKAILAGALGLEGADTDWTLSRSDNDVDTLAAAGATGSVAYRDADDLTIGTVAAAGSRGAIAGIAVSRTADITAGTTLTLDATGNVVSSATSGPAVKLAGTKGITTSANVTTSGGDALFSDATTLAADVAIDLVDGVNSGTVTFSKAVTGAGALTITGNLDAAASLGDTTALKSLAVSGDSTLVGGITVRTVGDQTFSGKATSAGVVTVQAGSGATVKFLGDTTLEDLVTRTTDAADYAVVMTGAKSVITEAVTFTNTGAVTLGDGASDDLWFKGGVESILPSGTSLGGTIRTTDAAATFGQKTPVNHAITLLADTTVSTGSGNATFSGTVDGAKRLVVNASGDTTFSSAVGGTTALAHVETDALGWTLLNGGSVTTDSPTSQVYNDAVILGADTVLTAGGGAAITFANTVDGAWKLTINTQGSTTFSKAVGGTTPLVSLTTDAGGSTAIDGGSVTTSSSAGQVYNDAVSLGVATTLAAGSAGVVTFADTLDGPGSLTVNTQGATTFSKAVGGTTALASLTTDKGGTTAIDGGAVNTTDSAGQVYNDAVSLGVATTLAAANAGVVTFADTLDGPGSLTVNTQGATTFSKAVGGTTALASLTTDKGGTTAIDGGSVNTTDSAGQVYNDAVSLGVATTLAAANAGVVTFADTLDGPGSLTVNTQGATTFSKAVGGTTALASLTTDKGGTTAIDGGSVNTTDSAGQVYNDAVSLGVATTLAAGNAGVVTFAETLDGPGSLTVNTQGATTFSKAVGGTTALASLTTDAGGSTNIDGGMVNTTDSAGQVYGDAVNLGAATTLSAGGKGPVTFSDTLDGAQSLTVNTQGVTTFTKAVGGTTPLVSLTTDAGGTTAIDGGSVTTSGSAGQTYGDDVTLGDDTTLTGDMVTTLGTLTGNKHDLTIAGKATLGDAAGDVVTGLASLTVTGVATVNASKVAATGTQTWKKTVTLGTDATFENGVLSFEDPIVGGGYDLTLTGTSVILGDAPADSVTGVDDLLINGPTVLNGNTITTTGAQTFNGGVTATQATAVVLSGKGIDFKQSLGRGEPGIVPPLTITAGTGGVTFGGDVGTGPDGRPFGTTEIRSEGGVSLAGTLWSNGPVTVASTKGSITGGVANAIRTPASTIRLEAATGIGTVAAPIGIEAAGGVTAATTAGGIFLRAVGSPANLWIGPAGLKAPGAIGLDAGTAIGVAAGGRIQAGTGVSATRSISWQVTTTADDVNVAGSLRQVVRNLNEVGDANKTATENGLDARLSFEIVSVASAPATTVFNLATPLPEFRGAVAIVGFGITFDGVSQSPGALVYGAAASGSTLQGLTLRNFRDYAIQLRSAQNVSVDRITVRGLNLITSMGIYATGNLAGTTVTGGTFTDGLRGMLLDGARGLMVGSTNALLGNTFANHRSVSTQPNFAGTGIRAQGDCAGTVVQGNSFSGNNYGFAFMAARNLALRNNFFARNSIAGIYIEGDCSGSTKSGNTFATASGQRNRVNIARTRTSRGA